MKKTIYFTIIMLFVTSLFSVEFAEYKEENGIEVNSHNSITRQRISRDIPEGGLLLIPDWSADRVMAFDPTTGVLYDADFIPSDETNLSSPKEAALHPDGNSILVSDQIEDGLLQYDLDGNFIGWYAPAGGVNNSVLDNVRGWGLKADGNILVTTASGSNTDAIVEFDTSGNHIGNFIVNGAGGMDGPFSILYREAQDDYLVTANTSDAVHQYDNTGSYIGDLVTGINFPQQIALAANGNLLVAGFSTPSGCYEYTSEGTFVGYYDVVSGLRGVYELPNGNILVTDANGVYEIDRNNTLVNTLMTGASAQFIHFVDGGGTNPDPPTNVMVDDETGTISWLPPLMPVIEDNFDSYTSGDYIAVVGDDWTTWSNAPGGAEDAFVTDAQSSSPDNSIVVELNQDLVLIMDDYTTGKYSFELKMFVPTGYCGYFNLQKTSTPGQEWAFQVYYQTDGMAYADMAAEAAYFHPFNHDEWMDLKVMVDLDNDWATYYFNGEEIGGYQWTLGTFGTPGLLQFGGVNIFGGANATQPTDIPMFYIDDVVLYEVSDEVTGFNLYLDGILDSTVGDDVTDYTYASLIPEVMYVAGVSALYGGDESDIVELPFTYDPVTSFDPPANPTASVVDYNDVLVTWNAPSGYNSRSLAGYKIYQDGVEVGEVADPATLSYLVECLDAGTYEFTITAFYTNPDGESVPTVGVNSTVVLNPPSNGTANSNPPNIVITWGAPARGVDNYNVYRDGVLHGEGVTGTMFIDIAVPSGNYIYNLTAVYCGGFESDFGPDITMDGHVDGDNIVLPTVTKLTGNYPNPFNPTTTISFSTKEAGLVSINIYNMKGQLVKKLVEGNLEAAYHDILWDGRDDSNKTVSSGIYFFKMKTTDYTATQKMILMK